MDKTKGDSFIEVYGRKAQIKSDELVSLFGKPLAIVCVDQILNVITPIDSRSRYWKLVKSLI